VRKGSGNADKVTPSASHGKTQISFPALHLDRRRKIVKILSKHKRQSDRNSSRMLPENKRRAFPLHQPEDLEVEHLFLANCFDSDTPAVEFLLYLRI
jgi:hypothetical protein